MNIGDRVQINSSDRFWVGHLGTVVEVIPPRGNDARACRVSIEDHPGRSVMFYWNNLNVVEPIEKEKVMPYIPQLDTIHGTHSSVVVSSEAPDSPAVVHVQTPEDGTSLNEWEMFSLIESMLKVSGTTYEFTGAMGLIIQRPESPYVSERREELSQSFFVKPFESLTDGSKGIIDYIIEGEVKRGELR